MALTAQALALRMAKHIGVMSFDPDDPSNTMPTFNRGLQTGDFEELTACINGALQEIWSTAPTAVSHYRQEVTLPAPVTTTLTLTQGSTAIAAFTGYAPWMAGCTLMVEGGQEALEIASGTALRAPYHEASGTVNAMIYADAVTLTSETMSLLEPLECHAPGKAARKLRMVLSYEEYQQESEAALRRRGMPEAAYLETLYAFAPVSHTLRLRVTPMPTEPVVLSFGSRLNVPAVVPTDISTLPDPQRRFPLPGGWDESVVLPLANRRLATHPDFVSLTTAVRQEIVEQAKTAHRILRSVSPHRFSETLHPTFR